MYKMFLLIKRHLIVIWRSPVWLIFTLIQPLIYLLLFGQLFSSLTEIPGFPVSNYNQFLTAGIMIMTCVFGAGVSGMSVIEELKNKIFDKWIIVAFSKPVILLSRMIYYGILDMILITFILLISVLLGYEIKLDSLNILLMYSVIFFLSLFLSAFSNFLVIIAKQSDVLIVIINSFTMPLLFLSSALMPLKFAPGWIQVISRFNPLSFGIETVRDLTSGVLNLVNILFTLGLYCILALFFLFMTVIGLKRMYD